jgi:cell division septation protein DedD
MTVVVIVCILVAIAAVMLGKHVMGRRATRRSEAWEGVVISKDRSSPDGQNMYHSVMVRLTNDTTKEIQIPGSLWETLSEGDKLQKRAGSYEPTKVK